MRLARETYILYLRNMRVWLAQPVAVISPIMTAAFMFLMFAAPLSEITRLPDFPTGDYDAFLTGMILVMAMVFSGSDMAMVILTDILSGYLDKLLLAPIHRFSILLGILLVAATRAFAQVLIIVVLALSLGVRFDTGPIGLLAVVVGTTIFGVAFSCLGIVIALKTKSTQVTMGTWLLFMPLAFVTTAFMPRELLTGWFKVAVTINPVDYVLVGVRAIIIQGWEWDAILPGLFWLIGLTVSLLAVAAWSFRRATA